VGGRQARLEADKPAYGFNTSGKSWLPQPVDWDSYARDSQDGVPGSTLELYKSALALRAEHGLGTGSLVWADGFGANAVAFRNGGILVVTNLGPVAVELPVGEILLSSQPIVGGALETDVTVWIRA